MRSAIYRPAAPDVQDGKSKSKPLLLTRLAAGGGRGPSASTSSVRGGFPVMTVVAAQLNSNRLAKQAVIAA